MNLLRAIRQGVWMIDEATKDAYLPFALRLLKGESVQFDKVAKDTRRGFVTRLGEWYGEDEAADIPPKVEGLVAVHTIAGVITKFDQDCGPRGTLSLMQWMQSADKDERVAGHILDTDSGGGEGTNIETVARFIRNNIKKPVIALVNGYCCSAAYYMACSADTIYATQSSDVFGSIGAMLTYVDILPVLEKEGVKIHEVYADGSELKNDDFHQMRKGEYQPVKNVLLNPMRDQFAATVQEFRPDLTDKDAYKGKVYSTNEALKIGMIDGIMTFEEAVARVGEMAAERKTFSNNNNSNMKNLTAALGELETDNKGGIYLNAAQIAALETHMEAEQVALFTDAWVTQTQAEMSELKSLAKETNAKLAEASTKLGTAETTIAQLRIDLDAMKVQIESFGKQPGSTRTLGYSDSDKPLISDDDEDDLMKMEKAMQNGARIG